MASLNSFLSHIGVLIVILVFELLIVGLLYFTSSTHFIRNAGLSAHHACASSELTSGMTTPTIDIAQSAIFIPLLHVATIEVAQTKEIEDTPIMITPTSLAPQTYTPITITSTSLATQTYTPIASVTPTQTSTQVPTVTSDQPRPTLQIIWSADHETGNLTQWQRDQNGEAVFNTGTGTIDITDSVAHSGRYALDLTIRDADGTTQASRIFRYHENLEQAYYSAWYYFPQVYTPEQWWNIFQFKSRTSDANDPIWTLDIDNRVDGAMFLYLNDWQNNKSYSQARLNVPVGRWTHIEVFYQRAPDSSGKIIVWQDGIELFHMEGVETALADNNVQWSLNNYTDSISPSTVTIYIDDATISATQVGP